MKRNEYLDGNYQENLFHYVKIIRGYVNKKYAYW